MIRHSRALLFALTLTTVSVSGLASAATSPLPPKPATAPASMTAVPGNGRVSLSWAAVSGATGYKIFRAVSGVWTPEPMASTSALTFTNTGLANGTVYSYRVAAYTRGGVGPSSADVSAMPIGPPTGVVATAGDQQVTVAWQPAAGASSYTLFRSQSSDSTTFTAIADGLVNTSFVDTALTNKVRYYYLVRAVAAGVISGPSAKVSAVPLPPPPASAPANITATPGNARVTLAWDAVATATGYRVFLITPGAEPTKIATVSTTTFKHYSLTNGQPYTYRIVARNDGGDGPWSVPVTTTPLAAPPAPTELTAVGGDHQVTLSWNPSPGAATYRVFRGTSAGRYATTPIATDLLAPSFVDSELENGPVFFYVVVAANVGGTSPRSAEARAATEGPSQPVDPETTAAFRLLRQATWGARPGDVDHVKALGRDAYVAEQLAAAPSTYPATLFTQSIEVAQEHFMHLALSGSDQLRQRVAWALHKIWVVSAVEVSSAAGIATYHQLLLNNAFGNYRALMKAMTLNPAMGSYLNMLNNRSEQVTGAPPNENYPRELMQLFVLGTATLRADGTPVIGPDGAPIPTYTQEDVKALARILTGWTFGDGDAATTPRRSGRENYRVAMEPVEAYHDTGAKVFLGETFPAGASASQDLDHALDTLFNHPNVGPFVASQLIKQLVTSNPSSAYVRDVAAAFADNGAGVRGDLAAVVRAILVHPEASAATPDSGKLAEPVLLITSLVRALNATVTDHPFMSDWAEQMGQKVFYPPSVFSYFSPGYRVRGTAGPGAAPLVGPEFQILTSVTALTRVNFIGRLLGGWFGSNVTVDYAPFSGLARDAAALTDYCNLVFTGGRMSAAQRAEIIDAVRAISLNSLTERVRTALFLTLVTAHTQVDR